VRAVQGRLEKEADWMLAWSESGF